MGHIAIGRLRLAIKNLQAFIKDVKCNFLNCLNLCLQCFLKMKIHSNLSFVFFLMNYQGKFIVLSLMQNPRISSLKLKLCKYCCVSWQYMQIAVVIPERYLLLLVSSLLFRAVAYTKPRELLSAMFMMALFSLSSASAHPLSYICNDEWQYFFSGGSHIRTGRREFRIVFLTF